MGKAKSKPATTVEDLLRDQMIIQLALAEVSGHTIRTIVGVDMNRVTRILKCLKKEKGK